MKLVDNSALPGRVETAIALIFAVVLANIILKFVGNKGMANAMMLCLGFVAVGLYTTRRRPFALALKIVLRAVGVMAGLICVILATTLSFGIRKMYTRSMYMYGAELDSPPYLLEGEVEAHADPLQLLQDECREQDGAGPVGTLRHIDYFEGVRNNPMRKGRVLQRARFFAREYYDDGALNSDRRWRKWCQDLLSALNLTPKMLAKYTVGMFQFMITAICWGPFVDCVETTDASKTCTGSCNFDWGYAFVAIGIAGCIG